MLHPGAGCSRPLSFGCAGDHSFVAESEREKREWMEALQEAIAEMLYDYEVAEKIWSNKANKYCADCWAQSPDWASINLCVVICKQCAGQYISPGVPAGVGSTRPGRQGAGWGMGATWVAVALAGLRGAHPPAPCRAAPQPGLQHFQGAKPEA